MALLRDKYLDAMRFIGTSEVISIISTAAEVITALGVIVIPIILYRYRKIQRAREKHCEDIKGIVFSTLFKEINGYRSIFDRGEIVRDVAESIQSEEASPTEGPVIGYRPKFVLTLPEP